MTRLGEVKHQPFDIRCRCKVCIGKVNVVVKQPIKTISRVLDVKLAEQASKHVPSVNTGPSVDNVHRQYHGPVFLKPTQCTFLHTRKLQHTHRTTFLQSSVPNRDTNFGSLFTELDARLHNMHRTLTAVQERSTAVVSQQQRHLQLPATDDSGVLRDAQGLLPVRTSAEHYKGALQVAYNAGLIKSMSALPILHAVSASTPSVGEVVEPQGRQQSVETDPTADTVALRRAVNQSMEHQLGFFTSCMARWCLKKCECRCLPCDCICQQTHAALAGAAWS
ncbi:hypothetical protein CEUSTIGMA_g5052.t1 [Chlamydomonas eustigma]|uniref:Uncharacterized protein n=1 Tax=Chlamydomonas eustigma TaxID=1157962 RepID=A0A250X3F6_9CHLO|nr:hypothetical protein CEUSTIGMA_g5052.t1 [Chlamydomonas eustigma]|eukprot:GAX77608.1 hypothetical protein CEUSTIGMA_g5052.t1 [Chlamydomonas eustigma]